MKVTNQGKKAPVLLKLGHTNKRNLLLFIHASTNIQVDKLVQYYLDYANKLLENEGELTSAKKLKELYGQALRFSAGVEFRILDWLRSDSQGLARVLKPFKPLLEGSPNATRAALTVLQLYKLIDAKGEPSLKSIVNPYTGKVTPTWLTKFDEVVLEEFPSSEISKRISKLRGDNLHISGKNGPNGPATLSLLADASSLVGTKMWQNITRLAAITGNTALIQIMSEASSAVRRNEVKHAKDRKPTHSRLRIKYEPGGKARVFAILDFFSQSALKPVHDYLMKWLKDQHQDGTSDHSLAAKQLAEWTASNNDIWSFDLTTATDRYPIFLQVRVMKRIFGDEITELWYEIITDREFVTPNGKETVKFAVGQPLGALSSWAAFSVTHHIHVRTAAKLAGVDLTKDSYRIIGDDISIFNIYRLALRYIGMMEDLSVPFSSDKSILPPQCEDGFNVGELAKRVFVNGSEITPVPPDEILIGMRSPFGKRILLESALGRGYTMLESPWTVQSFLKGNQEFAALTFPVGRTLPLLKGVKYILSGWDIAQGESPPAGLKPDWLYWETGITPINQEEAISILTSFLREKVVSAIYSSREVLRESTLPKSKSSKIYQGGDWQPGLGKHPRLVQLITQYFRNSLGKTLDSINEMTYREDMDLYRLISRANAVPKIEDLLGRQSFMDEKSRTRVLASILVKDATKLRNKPVEAYLQYICRYREI